MIINIGTKIKNLRAEKHITQEQLAVYLGVTPQAISRWEAANGYPDIEYLPRIADFFAVSIDDLLGRNQSQCEQRILEIEKQIIRLGEVGDDKTNLDFARKAVAQFPSNLAFQKNLGDCICRNYMWNDLQRDVSMLEEAEKIYNTILETTKDEQLKYEVITALCSLYGHGFNNIYLAETTANKLPLMSCSREDVKANMLKGEQSIKYKQKYIELLTDALGCEIQGLVLNGISNEPKIWDIKIEMMEKQIELYKMIFGDDMKFYNVRLSISYRIIATYFIAQGKINETLDMLEEAMKYTIAYDTAYSNEHDTTFTSHFVNKIPYTTDDYHELTEHSQSYYMLERMTQDRYDSIRDNERFKKIIERLIPYKK